MANLSPYMAALPDLLWAQALNLNRQSNTLPNKESLSHATGIFSILADDRCWLGWLSMPAKNKRAAAWVSNKFRDTQKWNFLMAEKDGKKRVLMEKCITVRKLLRKKEMKVFEHSFIHELIQVLSHWLPNYPELCANSNLYLYPLAIWRKG